MGEKLTIITYVPNNDKYYQIENDFIEMANKEDANESYEPTFFDTISKEVYSKRHPFENGSTIIIENIRDDIISNSKSFMEYLKTNLINTYGRTTLNIKLNNEEIPQSHNFFNIRECQVFNKSTIVYFNENKTPKYVIFIPKSGYYYLEKDKFVKQNYKQMEKITKEKDTIKLEFKTTFTWYYFNKLKKENKDKPKYPDGNINLYRKNTLENSNGKRK